MAKSKGSKLNRIHFLGFNPLLLLLPMFLILSNKINFSNLAGSFISLLFPKKNLKAIVSNKRQVIYCLLRDITCQYYFHVVCHMMKSFWFYIRIVCFMDSVHLKVQYPNSTMMTVAHNSIKVISELIVAKTGLNVLDS